MLWQRAEARGKLEALNLHGAAAKRKPDLKKQIHGKWLVEPPQSVGVSPERDWHGGAGEE
jgi:hypothetical protein